MMKTKSVVVFCACFLLIGVIILAPVAYKRYSSQVIAEAEDALSISNNLRRKLQFEGMFDTGASYMKPRRKKKGGFDGSGSTTSGGGSTSGGAGGGGGKKRVTRAQALTKAAEEISLGMDRYHLWWTGPPDPETSQDSFQRASWSTSHVFTSNAIFTTTLIQGQKDARVCSHPNDYILFFGTIRRVFDGDIVVAVDSTALTEAVKGILQRFRVVVYPVAADLCSVATNTIFCGSADERVPASVFRYYFYEKWAAKYSDTSLILLSDFRDIIFQQNPFAYQLEDWWPEHQLVAFQEFYPNMVIERCHFNRRILSECYGEMSARTLRNRVIVSSGALLGTKEAVLVWAHHVTLQLQEAPGRLAGETRCSSGGIDHAFINWLLYGNSLRSLIKVKLYPQGQGAVNSLGGLRPDTVQANLTGSLRSWNLFDQVRGGVVLNWNGDVSPVVHQLDHFLDELLEMTGGEKPADKNQQPELDDVWRTVVNASRCLWGCV